MAFFDDTPIGTQLALHDLDVAARTFRQIQAGRRSYELLGPTVITTNGSKGNFVYASNAAIPGLVKLSASTLRAIHDLRLTGRVEIKYTVAGANAPSRLVLTDTQGVSIVIATIYPSLTGVTADQYDGTAAIDYDVSSGDILTFQLHNLSGQALPAGCATVTLYVDVY